MSEIWKDIKGFEGLYQVSNTGRIKSFRKSTRHFNQPFHFLKPSIITSGYESVFLYKSPKDRHKFLVHRLVAEHFLDNPNGYPCVNHKDENKLNNNADNLEWCTYEYNNAYGTAMIRKIETKTVYSISQYALDGTWLATYRSASVASKILNISTTSIQDCCKNKTPYAHGYIWKRSQINQ